MRITHFSRSKHLSLYTILIFIGVVFFSCEQSSQPKPDGYLRLEYPSATYERTSLSHLFSFEKNKGAALEEDKNQSYKIVYPKMKATIYLNYKPVNGNLDFLLQDAQKLTYNHTIKATEIVEHPYVNPEDRVFGMFYNVTGDAATNVQFYATDSVRNFVVGTLYFYVKPNYDSIYPATKYIEKDMIRLMETIRWNQTN